MDGNWYKTIIVYMLPLQHIRKHIIYIPTMLILTQLHEKTTNYFKYYLLLGFKSNAMQIRFSSALKGMVR